MHSQTFRDKVRFGVIALLVCGNCGFFWLRDWIRSYIRSVVWHPNCFKIAVAGMDDIVRIYTDEPAIMPVLKVS